MEKKNETNLFPLSKADVKNINRALEAISSLGQKLSANDMLQEAKQRSKDIKKDLLSLKALQAATEFDWVDVQSLQVMAKSKDQRNKELFVGEWPDIPDEYVVESIRFIKKP